MTDKELLELAAKAAGIDRGADRLDFGILVTEKTGRRSLPKWNPLEDDGDAFRLMLNLGLRFEYFAVDPFEISGKPVCVITWAPGGVHNRELETLTGIGNDVSAVVRTLIVRAASKIGSRMP